jgi:integrase
VAVTQGCVPFNAAQGTVLPNIERTPPTPLTDAQIIKFFERIKYHEKRDIFIFALLTGLTGLRESELIGLTVDCLRMRQDYCCN